jgi:signal peptidase II
MDPRVLLASSAAVAVAADQTTKAVALAALEDGRSSPVIDGVLHWTLQRNPGAAFGIFQRAPVLFTVLAIGIAVFILAIAPRVKDNLNGVALGLVLGGALGNLTDRLFRPPGPFRGRVIDFIDFRIWPTFNLADVAVVVGAGLLAIASFRADREAARPAT